MDDDGFEACTTYRDFVITFFSLKRCVPENENQGEKNPEFLTFFLLFDNFESFESSIFFPLKYDE
jgi:hypothetical protein